MDIGASGMASLKGMEYFTALEKLLCHENQLPSFVVTQNTVLTELAIAANKINGADMDALIAGLPSTGGVFHVYDPSEECEQNVLNTILVAAAKEKGWTPLCFSAFGTG